MAFFNLMDEIYRNHKRFQTEREVENMFVKEGYTYIEPNCFEDYDFVDFLNQRIKKESMVKVLNGNGDVLIVRPDVTTSLMKKFIPCLKENGNIKVFYNTTVFKSDEKREIQNFYQMGVEYIGKDSSEGDGDMITLVLQILKKYSEDFIVEINNSKYIDGLLREEKLKEHKEKIKDLLYRKSRFALIDYINKLSLNSELVDCLKNILDFQGDFYEVLKKVNMYYMNDYMKEALIELKNIYECIDEEDHKYIHFDLSMTTEMDYYDGVVFKGYCNGSIHEIISGGRYDSFTQEFGRKVPAIGFCVYIDALMKLL
ncbi:ATP phosphoribosyltransferase regulatory subunit [Haloimpatiens sp. FM7330]|uniref:ATP phosphoribosyltransferase regulatory subunit n=1 Tax=Haloimpatiens sp. FM7330 TaxID=3298610 RepID=UPI0036347248